MLFELTLSKSGARLGPGWANPALLENLELFFKEMGFPGGSVVKDSPADAGDARNLGSIPGSGDLLEQEMGTYSSILAGKFHGQRNLVGCNPWGHRVGHD